MADNSVWTIKKVLIWTTGYFEKHGIDSARLDAELLLSHVLGKSRIYLYTEFERILAAKELALFKKYIQNKIVTIHIIKAIVKLITPDPSNIAGIREPITPIKIAIKNSKVPLTPFFLAYSLLYL